MKETFPSDLVAKVCNPKSQPFGWGEFWLKDGLQETGLRFTADDIADVDVILKKFSELD